MQTEHNSGSCSMIGKNYPCQWKLIQFYIVLKRTEKTTKQLNTSNIWGPYFDKIDHRCRRIICNPLTEIRQLPIVYFDMQTVIAMDDAYIKLRYHALNSTAICQLLYWSVHYTNVKSCMHSSATIVQVLHHKDKKKKKKKNQGIHISIKHSNSEDKHSPIIM